QHVEQYVHPGELSHGRSVASRPPADRAARASRRLAGRPDRRWARVLVPLRSRDDWGCSFMSRRRPRRSALRALLGLVLAACLVVFNAPGAPAAQTELDEARATADAVVEAYNAAEGEVDRLEH